MPDKEFVLTKAEEKVILKLRQLLEHGFFELIVVGDRGKIVQTKRLLKDNPAEFN
jgi:hypothetical protein